MKLLQINAVYGLGSTGTIVKEIDELAQQAGIDSYVAYSQASVTPRKGYKIGGVFGKKMHAVFSRIAGKQAYFSRHSTRKLLKYIDEISPDIVHLHNLHANYIHLNMLLKYLASKQMRVIITQHDCWYYTGKCFHYTAQKCEQWKTGCKQCPKRFSDTPAYLYTATEKVWRDREHFLTAIKDLTIVSVSEWLTKETEKSFLKDKRLLTIRNGINLEVFRPRGSQKREQYNLEGKIVLLGMANKWLSERNAGIKEQVLKRLDDRYILVLVGCTARQRLIREKRVLKLGYIRSNHELAEIYSMVDVFVNLTWEDSLPTVNFETVACGTPIITNAVSGATETIDANVGLWVEPGNVEQLVQNIEKITTIGRNAYESKCREYALQYWDRHTCFRKYIELYMDNVK